LTGLIGLLIQPWRLLASVGNYVFLWLNGVSIVLGACGGVLIADYWFLRRHQLDLAGLYRENGPYWYRNGWNPAALIATALGTAPCIPGLLATLKIVDEVDPFWSTMYDVSWFVSFGVSFATYYALMTLLGDGTTPPRDSNGAFESRSS
jgi:NCS1 family nucleobase:cation symporter-1